MGKKTGFYRTLLAMCAVAALFLCASAAFSSPAFSRLSNQTIPAFAPSASPALPASAPSSPMTLVLLGDARDPACAPLYEGLEALCQEENWTFVSYDCRGREANQAGQVDDLLRWEGLEKDGGSLGETARDKVGDPVEKVRDNAGDPAETAGNDVDASDGEGPDDVNASGEKVRDKVGDQEETVRTAVVFPCGGAESTEEWARELERDGWHVVVLEEDLPGLAGQAADCFERELPGGEVLLLPTEMEDPMEELCREALEKRGLTVEHIGYSWAVKERSEGLLETALTGTSGARGILCWDEIGALAAAKTVGALGLEDQVTVLCLEDEPRLLEEVQLGRLQGVAAPEPDRTMAQLRRVLRGTGQGKRRERVALGARMVTQREPDAGEDGETGKRSGGETETP